MQQRRLEGMRVAILVADEFEQSELTDPRQALAQAGATALIVAPKPGKVQGVHHATPGDTFEVEATLDHANPDDFDAVLLPGGALNADKLRVNPQAQQFVRRIDETDRPIAVICHGPWLLVSASLVNGRTMTSYHTIQDDLRNAGARWLDLEVVRDRNWVSSRNPRDLPAFDEAMVALFAEYKRRRLKQRAAG